MLRRVFGGIGRFLKGLFFRQLTLRQWLMVFGVVGLMFISGIVGATIMHFKIGPAPILEKSFVGMQALMERGRKQSEVNGSVYPAGISVDIPEQTYDGFTLVTLLNGPHAKLIDMKGDTVHEWNLPFSKAWPHPTHVKSPLPDEQVDWFRAHLFPNGDLLAVYQTGPDTPHGYGLAKMTKDSEVIWTYSQNAHHDFDVGEDGKIYALTHQLSNERPAGLDTVPVPYLTDYLVVLSPDGKELEKISLLEAMGHSPYALLLSSMNNLPPSVLLTPEFTNPLPDLAAIPIPKGPSPDMPPMPKGLGRKMRPPDQGPRPNRATRTQIVMESGDVLHSNSVKVLRPAMAAKFPKFKAGQVLISMRTIDSLLVLDIPTRSVVWATQNIWRGQHDAEFLDNGHLLIFDNYGSSHMSRVIEFDPDNCAMPWSYSNENSKPFLTIVRGMKRRLPNGNTLIVDPELCRIFEVTLDKKLVWELGTGKSLTGAVRYRQDQLGFLGNRSPRP